MTPRRAERPLTAELRWLIGAVVGTLALAGTLILVVLVAVALQPPSWMQILIGVLLVAGSVLLAWLVAEALKAEEGPGGGRAAAPRPRSLPPNT